MCVIGFHIVGNECSIRDVMLHVSGKLMHIITVIAHFVFLKLRLSLYNCMLQRRMLVWS
jgi:hypothetical protein